jgi:hypothetical protein
VSSEYVCPHCVKNHVLFNKTSIEKDVMMTIEKPFTSKLKQLWFESDTIKSQSNPALEVAHCLGMNYYVNFWGGIDGNGFDIK